MFVCKMIIEEEKEKGMRYMNIYDVGVGLYMRRDER